MESTQQLVDTIAIALAQMIGHINSATNTPLLVTPLGRPGFRFPEGGGGAGSIEPSGQTPPKRGSIDGTPKIPQKPTRGRPWFQWRWYFWCLRTQGPPPVNSSYMYVAPHHGLPLEPHELVRLRVANRVTVRVSDNVAVGIRVRVTTRARARVRVGAGVKGGGTRCRPCVKKSRLLHVTCSSIQMELHLSGWLVHGCNDGQHQSWWH